MSEDSAEAYARQTAEREMPNGILDYLRKLAPDIGDKALKPSASSTPIIVFLRARCTDGHSSQNCCMARLLGTQPDFLHQAENPWIKEVVESLGHKCLFLPKFHCELNIIEYFWGASKRYTRENCDYSWGGFSGPSRSG